MDLQFRNLNAEPSDPVSTWPYEGVVTCLERGLLPDLARLAAEIRRDPHGRVAQDVVTYLGYSRPRGIAPLFDRVLADARGLPWSPSPLSGADEESYI